MELLTVEQMHLPVRFQPLYQSRVWGGRALGEVFPRALPGADLGELAPKVQRILKMDEPARIREAVERLVA